MSKSGLLLLGDPNWDMLNLSEKIMDRFLSLLTALAQILVPCIQYLFPAQSEPSSLVFLLVILKDEVSKVLVRS